MGFLVKKYTCPVIFLGCPGRPGLVFVGPWVGTPTKKLGRGVGLLPKTLTLFVTKICDFPYPIYDLNNNLIPDI